MLHGPATKNDDFKEIIFNWTEKSGPVTKTISNPAKNNEHPESCNKNN